VSTLQDQQGNPAAMACVLVVVFEMLAKQGDEVLRTSIGRLLWKPRIGSTRQCQRRQL
jgi:hypothetical protein